MSKLIDKLRAAARGVPPRMGFGGGGPKPKAPGIGLLASVGESLELASQASGFADALIIQADGASTGTLAEQLGSAIFGLSAADKVEQHPDLKAAGADFLVIGRDTDAVALRSEEGAKLLRLTLDTPDGSLRAISVLPIDALLVENTVGKRLSVDELLNYLRLGALSGRPLIVTVDADFAPDQLVSLRDASVAAVCLPVRSAKDVEVLRTFRETIDHFPQPPRRDRGFDRTMPVVSISATGAASTPGGPAEPAGPDPAPAPFPDDD